jgi:hypothetical protein
MANAEHIKILEKGLAAWNGWYEANSDLRPDLSEVDLVGRDLRGYVLTYSNLSGTNLTNANLSGADLSGADLRSAILNETNLGCEYGNTDLKKADLRGAFLGWANLTKADLSGAKLNDANLIGAHLIETDLTDTILTGCRIYGISAWNLKLEGTSQLNLIITPPNEPDITVDNLEVAQFIYLMLHNEKIRDVIDTIGKKGVLILGRFTPTERKAVLDEIREKLRQLGYVPIVFDFERPTDRDFTETIMTLAGMCRFIIADITNPKSSPLELQATIPDYMIPFVPIIQKGEKPFAMFKDLQIKYRWVLDVLVYDSMSNLIESFEKEVVNPALEKHNQLIAEKAEGLRIRHIGGPTV